MKAINLKPLLNIGLSEKEAKEMVVLLQGQVCLDLYRQIKASFSAQEKEELEGKLAQITGEKEQLALLEELYFQKTDQSFLQAAAGVMNKYLVFLAKVLKQTKEDLKTLSQADQEQVKILLKDLEKKEGSKARQILDEMLCKADNQPRGLPR